MNADGISARALDLLETDGGWLTADGLAHALDARVDSVLKALQRLEQRGLVEHRTIDLAHASTTPRTTWRVGSGGLGYDRRGEWRFKTWGEWYVSEPVEDA